MGYLTNGLSFRTLRAANCQRLPQFKDAQGRLSHSHPTGADWSPAEWLQATVGELGELANLMKKIRRGDFDISDPKIAAEVRHELADVAIYLDLLALQFDVDLGEAIREKFNIVSRRVSASVFIGDDDDWRMHDPVCPAQVSAEMVREANPGGMQEHRAVLDAAGIPDDSRGGGQEHSEIMRAIGH